MGSGNSEQGSFPSPIAIRFFPYGLIAMLVAGPGVSTRSARRANSHSSERVLRGSITSSTQNFSASILDLLQLGGRIFRRFDVGAIGRFDAAFQRQRAPIGRRPCVTHRVAVGRLVHNAGDAERVAHDDGAPGNGALVDGDRRGLLGLEPDHETRAIHQIDHGQMERLGKVDPAYHLVAGI